MYHLIYININIHMNVKKQRSFIDLLDEYKKKKELDYADYVTIVSIIHKSYGETMNRDTRVYPIETYYPWNSSSMWNFSFAPEPKGNQDLSQNSILNLLSPMSSQLYVNDNMQHNEPNTSYNPYLLWQKQHDVSSIFEKKPVKEEKVKKTKTCIIDASMATLDDILTVIGNNEYKADTEYNIDLKALHNIKEELVELNAMIGMAPLKQSVVDQLFYFIQELHVGKNISDYKNTVFYGSPGTGKTDVAKIIGKMYSKLGILKNNVFKKVTRNDLIAGYLGQTAIKTRKVIDECIGGVLFIDEAYSLGNSDNADSYSKECLDVLCEAMSDNKKDLMVIIAGYEDELNDTFFRVNKGLQSRFIWRFNMGEYTAKELKLIFMKMIKEQEWSYVNDLGALDKWFDDKKDDFKNYGRDVELLVTYTKIVHGRRVYGKDVSLRKKITTEDINAGYQTYVKNKKKKPEPTFMHTIYV